MTFTATVSGSDGGAPGGTVQLMDGANALGDAVTVNTLGAGYSIAGGGQHTCALTAAGGVKCWGWNGSGQLGDGTAPTLQAAPVAVSGLSSGVVALAAGASHTCALTAGGGVQCWGSNIYGQLGDGTTAYRTTPVAVLDAPGGQPISGVVAIAAGEAHTCALTADGGVKCWGDNGNGAVGNGTTTGSRTPVAVSGLSSGVVALAAGAYHTCALTGAGGVQCWGLNLSGQLGDGTISGVVAIAAGRLHTCALTAAGRVQCWGHNGFGQLGDGMISGVVAIATGESHTCALTGAGGVKCWGYNIYGQLGSSTDLGGSSPMPHDTGLSGIAAIASGAHHICALTAARGVKCWGWNRYSQLGNSTNSGTNSPTPTPLDVTDFGAGSGQLFGKARLSTATLAFGSHTITAVYSGDTNYPASTSSVLTQVVDKIASTTALGSSLNPSVIGQPVTFTATVPSGATGTVTFAIDGVDQGAATVSAGTATLTTSALDTGVHTIAAHYDGDSSYLGSDATPLSQTVYQPPAITSSASAIFTIGSAGSFTVTATGNPAPALGTTSALPSGVSFTDNGDGSATLAGTPAAGTAGPHSLTVVASNGVSPNAQQSFTLTVNKISQTVGFTSSTPGSATVGGVPYTPVAPATSGLAVTFGASGACSYSGGAVHFTAVGSCVVTADQIGDDSYYPASQASQNFSVGQGATTTALVSSGSPSATGQQVTFTATVSAGDNQTPGGTVTFKDGGTTIGSAALSSRQAALTVALTTIGDHTITAAYGGDANFLASTSSGLTQSVGKAPSAAFIRSSLNPSSYGQSVAFTVTVSGSSAGAPTGTVQFKDGASELGSAVTVNILGVGYPIAAGDRHTCAVTAAGGVKCWGNNQYSQLGSSTNSGTSDPNPTPLDTGLAGIVAVTAGTNHTCALTVTGGVECWGYNGEGELGSDPNVVGTSSSTPLDTGLTGIAAIAAGNYHTCALTSAGGVKCWGRNAYGQLGSGSATYNANPTPLDTGLSGIVAIAAGGDHTCALTAGGGVKCWGVNYHGELGNSANNGKPLANPTPLDTGLTGIVAIAAGANHTCAVTAAGGVQCWGNNGTGELGSSTNLGSTSSTPLDTGLTAIGAIAAGDSHTCALTAGGGVKCWGYNWDGQLGTGSRSGGLNPTPLDVTDFGDGSALVLGNATTTTAALTVGSHSITAVYSGGVNHAGSTSDVLTQTVEKLDQTASFTSTAPSNAVVGGLAYTPAATATSGLTVTFGASGACSYSDGAVHFNAAGSCIVTADQPGNSTYNPAPQASQDITVAGAATTVTASAVPATVKAGQSVTLRATVTAPSVVTPGGSVTFKEGTRRLGTANVANKVAQLAVPGLTIGTHIITAEYSGDANLTGSSNTTTATVSAKAGAANASDIKANAFTTGAQQFPAIAKTKNGYVIVWASNGQDRNKYGVYGQRYTNNGVKVGAELHVSKATAGNQTAPKVAGLAGGRFVVVWQSDAQDGSGSGIYGRSFSAAGVAGAEIKVNTTTKAGQADPTIAALSGGGFAVAWTSSDGSGAGIYAQRFDGKAKPAGVEFEVNTTRAGAQSAPAIAALKDGGFVVVWQGSDANRLGIFGQRYDKTGKAVGKQFAVNKTVANDQSLPSVAGTSDGGFVVAWQSELQDGSGLGVFMRRFNVRGATAGGDLRVNTMTANNQWQPAVSAFSDDGFVVLWSSNAQDGSGQGVYAQAFTKAGTKADAEFLINTTTQKDQWQPAVAAASAGNFMAAWASASTQQDIFAQRFMVPID